MNERLAFIILVSFICVLWYVIGYWRRKAGETAFIAAQKEKRKNVTVYATGDRGYGSTGRPNPQECTFGEDTSQNHSAIPKEEPSMEPMPSQFNCPVEATLSLIGGQV